MDTLKKVYDFYRMTKLEKGIIGKSEGGRIIPYIHLGEKNGKNAICTYSIHAREHITSLLALKQIEYLENKKFDEYGIYFIPIMNPDGVELCEKGLNSAPKKRRKFLKTINGGEDFSLYKANYNGVDLNVNFDALYGNGKLNKKVPSSANYIGEYAFSEKETRALKRFTEKVAPFLTISFHCKGEEIYWNFYQDKYHEIRDRRIADKIALKNGYTVKTLYDSCGGYKDWCISSLKIPAFTIEVGSDELSHPIGEEALKDIFKKNKDIFYGLSDV